MMPLLSLHRRNTFVQNQILVFHFQTDNNNNLSLTEREGRTGEYWPEVVTVGTERSKVRTKTTE